MTPELALERAKIHLMQRPNSIFYTTILFSLRQEWTEEIPTAAVDGISLFINPDFFIELPERQRMFLLCHEVLHVALDHFGRTGDKDKRVMNEAGDHVINLSLIDAGYEPIPIGLMDKQFRNMNTEQVYDILFKEHEKKGDLASFGIPGGNDVQYPKDSIDAQIVQRNVTGIVLKATIQATSEGSMPGSIPGEIAIQLEQMINPKLPWEVILQNYISQFAKDDYSWSKPNRRYLPDFYLPSAYSESICDIATAVDISGSVQDHEFNFFIGEHESLQQSLHPDKMTVISFDTEIINVQEVSQSTNVWSELSFHGRGGTDLHNIFEWAVKNEPTVLLIFTDGDFDMPTEKHHPLCPVVWLIHDNENFTAPFGEVIYYDIEEP